MIDQLKMLEEFHRTFGLTVESRPTGSLTAYDHKLRYNLIAEELAEWDDAVTNAAGTKNVSDVAKELADLLYVVMGTIVTHGLTEEMERVFAEVHRSNMSKLWADGTVHRREDGKVLKPTTYSPADLEHLNVEVELD